MVQAMIRITDQTNRVLNIVKAKYNLNDKSQAIDMVVSEYSESLMEPYLKPEYIQKIKTIESKGKFRKYTSLKELEKEIRNA